MTTALVFSRNRPAQLDLLLRSVRRNAPYLNPVVLYRADSLEYVKGYVTCHVEHPSVTFMPETRFDRQVMMILGGASSHIMFLCDDDVVFRPISSYARMLEQNMDVLCFCYRLGMNTTYCYPLRRGQKTPEMLKDVWCPTWEWEPAEYDWGYPGSIDGSLFRTGQVFQLLNWAFHNPNELEEVLLRNSMISGIPKLACDTYSSVVGMPLNLVNETHNNRFDETQPTVEEINNNYLAGKRISLSTVVAADVNAAHRPFPLVWEDK